MRDLSRTYCTRREWICSTCKKTPPHIATFTMQRFDASPCPDQVSPLFCTFCQLVAPVTCILLQHNKSMCCWKRDRNQLCVHEWDTGGGCPWTASLHTLFQHSAVNSQTSCSALINITATNTNKNTCERTVVPLLPALTHSISIQEHPPHLPTRWRTAERKLPPQAERRRGRSTTSSNTESGWEVGVTR